MKRISESLKVIRQEVKNAYDHDPSLYYLLDYLFGDTRIEVRDGECIFLDNALEDITKLQDVLETHDDVILVTGEDETLLDLGYKFNAAYGKIYEKTIEDTEEREIVDEILITEEGPLRRIRKIEWEVSEYSRSSKSIKYRKLPIGKKLKRAIDNTSCMDE
ncbi:MAG: hypothetical protein II736_02285 [Clostridia bacterium]|nr:hypothetical protein [Clostridia bacterium]